MSYATRSDIDVRITQAELVRITDEDDTGNVDETKVEDAIIAAGLEIDSYLAANDRYKLPLVDPPKLLTHLAVDLAIWNLYSIADADGMPQTRADRRQAALDILNRLADGSLALGSADPGKTGAYFVAAPSLFSRRRSGGCR